MHSCVAHPANCSANMRIYASTISDNCNNKGKSHFTVIHVYISWFQIDVYESYFGWVVGGVRKRDPNDKNYSVANPFGLQYASQAPVVQWIAPRTGIELIDPLQTDEQVSMIKSVRNYF
jgi:hypothetical protein